MTQLVKSAAYTNDQVALIRNTVAKGCNDDEMQLFMHLSQKYDLDPFAKEIWCIKRNQNDPALIMTARDGYLKIANSSPSFDGIASGVVREGDVYMRNPNGSVTHQFSDKRGNILGAFAIVKRKDRVLDAFGWAEFSEYKGNSPTWSKYPSAMIMKVAEVIALKRAFTISGLVTQEEIGESNPTPKQETGQPQIIDIKAEEVQETRTDDIMAALEKGNAMEQPIQPTEQITIPEGEKPTGQQIAVLNSLLLNPVFTREEAEQFKAAAAKRNKEQYAGLIKKVTNETVNRQKANAGHAQAAA